MRRLPTPLLATALLAGATLGCRDEQTTPQPATGLPSLPTWTAVTPAVYPFTLTMLAPGSAGTRVDEVRFGALRIPVTWDSVNHRALFAAPTLPPGAHPYVLTAGGTPVGSGTLRIAALAASERPKDAFDAFLARYDQLLGEYQGALREASVPPEDDGGWTAAVDSVADPLIGAYRGMVSRWRLLPEAVQDTIGRALLANRPLVDSLLAQVEQATDEVSASLALRVGGASAPLALARMAAPLTPRSIIGRCEMTLDKLQDAAANNNWWARWTSFSGFFGQGAGLTSGLGRLAWPLFVLGTGMSVSTAVADLRLAYSRYDDALVPRREGGNLAITFSRREVGVYEEASVGAVVVLEPIGNTLSDLATAGIGAGVAGSDLRSWQHGFNGQLRTRTLKLFATGLLPWLLQPDLVAAYEHALGMEQALEHYRVRSGKRRTIRVDPELVYFSPGAGPAWSIRSLFGLQLTVAGNPDRTHWQTFTTQGMTSRRAGERGYDVCNLRSAEPDTANGLNAIRLVRAPERVTLGSRTLGLRPDASMEQGGVHVHNGGQFETTVQVRVAPGYTPPGGVSVLVRGGVLTIPARRSVPTSQQPTLVAQALPGTRSQVIRVPIVAEGSDGKPLACAVSTLRVTTPGGRGPEAPSGQLTLSARGGSSDPDDPLNVAIMVNGTIQRTITLPGNPSATISLARGYNTIYYLFRGGPRRIISTTIEVGGLTDADGNAIEESYSAIFTPLLASPSGRNRLAVSVYQWPAVREATNGQWIAACRAMADSATG